MKVDDDDLRMVCYSIWPTLTRKPPHASPGIVFKCAPSGAFATGASDGSAQVLLDCLRDQVSQPPGIG